MRAKSHKAIRKRESIATQTSTARLGVRVIGLGLELKG